MAQEPIFTKHPDDADATVQDSHLGNYWGRARSIKVVCLARYTYLFLKKKKKNFLFKKRQEDNFREEKNSL